MRDEEVDLKDLIAYLTSFASGKSFDFLNDEDNIYSVNDLRGFSTADTCQNLKK